MFAPATASVRNGDGFVAAMKSHATKVIVPEKGNPVTV
jgi:hypothetical protein